MQNKRVSGQLLEISCRLNLENLKFLNENYRVTLKNLLLREQMDIFLVLEMFFPILGPITDSVDSQCIFFFTSFAAVVENHPSESGKWFAIMLS